MPLVVVGLEMFVIASAMLSSPPVSGHFLLLYSWGLFEYATDGLFGLVSFGR